MAGNHWYSRQARRSREAARYVWLAKLFAKWSRNALRLAVAIDPKVKR